MNLRKQQLRTVRNKKRIVLYNVQVQVKFCIVLYSVLTVYTTLVQYCLGMVYACIWYGLLERSLGDVEPILENVFVDHFGRYIELFKKRRNTIHRVSSRGCWKISAVRLTGMYCISSRVK